MSNYTALKNTIDANIRTNGEQLITGSVLNLVLNDMVDTLGSDIESLDSEMYGGIIPNPLYTGLIGSNGNWLSSSNYHFYVLDVTPGETLHVKTNITYNSVLCELESFDGVNAGQAAPAYNRIELTKNTEQDITIGLGKTKLMVFSVYNQTDRMPRSITRNGIEILVASKGVLEVNHDQDEKIGKSPENVTAQTSTSARTDINITYRISPGRKYRVVLNSWDGRGVTGDAMVCGFFFMLNNSLVSYAYSDSRPIDLSGTIFEFTALPSGQYDKFYAAARADTSVDFTITDITDKNTLYATRSDLDALTKQVNDIIGSPETMEGIKPIPELFGNVSLNKDLTARIVQETILDSVLGASEATYYNPFETLAQARKTAGMFVVNLITDTHLSKVYMDDGITAIGGVRVFNKLSEICDVSMHCGDIISEPCVSEEDTIGALRCAVEMFRPASPFMIAKGNHDFGNPGYKIADIAKIDFDNVQYYVRSGASFNPVTFDTWDGSTLYEAAPAQKVSSKSFVYAVQKYKAPSDAVWGDGAYYFYDIDTLKLRIIVLDLYELTNELSGGQSKWFAETALDLSSKVTPSDWKVITLSHNTLHGNTQLVGILSAFMSGTSTSGTQGGVSWSKNFSSQGAGHYIANLHGHIHAIGYTDEDGFNDICFDDALCNVERLGNAYYYGNALVAFDFAEQKIYCDQINGNARVYDFYVQ
jgi:predicted phosphodiesterase